MTQFEKYVLMMLFMIWLLISLMFLITNRGLSMRLNEIEKQIGCVVK